MRHYLIFAGTTEGREFIEFLIENTENIEHIEHKKKEVQITACTATEYGKILLPSAPNLTVISKRLDYEDMVSLMKNSSFHSVYDATHPYATLASENILAAAKQTKLPYFRILRPEENFEDDGTIVHVNSMEEAVSYLSKTTGNILCTTGSKELAALCKLPDYQTRVYARILPNPEMVSFSYQLGFQGKHLICMQGPFSEELNTALIHQFHISYLLTKSSGKPGGFLEKVNSARQTGITLVVIGRPTKESGYTLEEIKNIMLPTLP